MILYELVTGQVPFQGDTPFTTGVKHKSETPRNPKELNTQIPEDLSRIIRKCWQKEKINRYQSVEDLRSTLENMEKVIPPTESEISKKKAITSKDITVHFNVKRLLIPAAAVIVLVIAAVVIWQFRHPEAEIVAPLSLVKKTVGGMIYVNARKFDLGIEQFSDMPMLFQDIETKPRNILINWISEPNKDM